MSSTAMRTFHRLIGDEYLKLRTTRSPFVIIGAAQLVVILGISGVFVSGRDPFDSETVLLAFSHIGIVSIFSLMLGITAVAGEYRNKTVTDTYLATPSRGRVVGAKIVAYAVVGVGLGLLATLTASAATAIWLDAKGTSLDIGMPGLGRTVLGCLVWNVCFAAVGVGVGAFVRNLSGAVAGALVWIAIVEGMVGQLVEDASRWLPFRAGSAMQGLPSMNGGEQLSQVSGGLVLVAYAGTFVAVALATSMRRDVT
ncbi:MAG: ABC transporter permease subunit [Demequinaceae bacterium]|nr:ABC transporter permease subunit [Demequinaceae bacterium]